MAKPLMYGLHQWTNSQLFNYYAGFRIRLIWLLEFDVGGGFGKRSDELRLASMQMLARCWAPGQINLILKPDYYKGCWLA